MLHPSQWPADITEEQFLAHFAKAVDCHKRDLEYPLYEPTPVFSVWPMRKKWERFGKYWGYVLLLEARKDRSDTSLPIQCPPIQLAYAKTGESVIQVAYWSELELQHEEL